jgi:hypothetical protein
MNFQGTTRTDPHDAHLVEGLEDQGEPSNTEQVRLARHRESLGDGVRRVA